MRVLGSWWFVLLLLLGVTAAHLVTSTDTAAPHNVFRRLYYVPIILAAFRYGTRGGVGCALAASALYFPHAFLMHHHLDPAPTADKVLEMVLYLVVGWLTGELVMRHRRAIAASRASEDRALRLESLVTLSSGLAHEIRNPLSAIQGAFEILSDEVEPGSSGRRFVDLGLRETARLDRVLSDFRTYARPREPEPRRIDLCSAVRAVAEPAGLTRDDVTVRTSLPASPVHVVVDAGQLEQCLLNLALNAVQWSNAQGEVVLLVRSGVYPAVVVEDRGPGIPEADRERIFVPYFTRREGGSGLGLAIAAQLARANGGRLEYHPREGGGARFVLELGVTAPRRGRQNV